MLRVTLRDLQWRRRRFVITIVGTSLVFAMTLLLTGLS
ncbi:MAG TPA: glutamine ABC transporter permease, partial [Mycobacterium sp.]|nr:glutamine ABC transporter permease [Mycobacterium sp.]